MARHRPRKDRRVTPAEHGVNAILVAQAALDAARTGTLKSVPVPAPAGLLWPSFLPS
jgi:hypothetical protein